MSNTASTVLLKPLLVSLFSEKAIAGATAVFGSGGHTVETGLPLAIEADQVALHTLLIEKTIPEADITVTIDGNVMITGRLAQADLVGETVSEFGIKIDGDLVGIRNSAPKIKQSDEEFETVITFVF
jgi:hypothetical protein